MYAYFRRKLKAVFLLSVFHLFASAPHRGVRFLHSLNLDLDLYSLPLIYIYNLRSIKRLKRLQKAGKNPKVVFFSMESDGRFDRMYQLSFQDDDVVFFRIPIHTFAVENIFFESYAKKGCGFYEDSRQKYILPDNLDNRLKYRAHMMTFLKKVEKMINSKVSLYLSGSGNDRYVQELITAFQDHGGSWVVCEREGTGTNFTYQIEGECFRQSGSVQAHYIFCANDKHRAMFDMARTPSVKEIKVLGELDSDFWFHWDRKFIRKQYADWDKYKRKVLFLTFGLRNYIEPYIFPQYPDMNWKTLLSETEDEMFEFAKRNPDILVFYKMGHIEDNNKVFIDRCQAAGLVNVVPLTRVFPCEELILYSDLIIGFQTTAMFEAMFSDKAIFQLNWAIPSQLDPSENLLPISNLGACKVMNSKDELRASLDRWVSGDKSFVELTPEILAARKTTREIMFWKADGRVAERGMVEIKRILAL